MAKTFNGGIWSGIGDSVARDDMFRNERDDKALGGLLEAAKFIEKINANRKMQKDWEDYFKGKKERQTLADMAEAEDVEYVLELESLPAAASLLVDEGQVPDEMEDSIWGGKMQGFLTGIPRSAVSSPSITDPSIIATDDDDVTFMQSFNPVDNRNDIKRAQTIIGTEADGIWGPKSWNAYYTWRG